MRQRHRHQRPLSLAALQQQPAAVSFRHPAADRQAQSDAPGQIIQPPALRPPVKNRLQILRRNTGACVFHAQQHLLAFDLQHNGDASGRGRELQRIAQQVPHQPLQICPVHSGDDISLPTDKFHLDAPLMGNGGRLTAQLIQPYHQLQVLRLKRSLRQQLRPHSQIAHQPQHPVIALLQDSAFRGVLRFRHRQPLCRHVQIVQRRAQRLRNIRQHTAKDPFFLRTELRHSVHLVSLSTFPRPGVAIRSKLRGISHMIPNEQKKNKINVIFCRNLSENF